MATVGVKGLNLIFILYGLHSYMHCELYSSVCSESEACWITLTIQLSQVSGESNQA